jgi:casein kinase II subunit alpha
MGTNDLFEYLKTYDLPLNPYHQQNLSKFPVKPLRSFTTSENRHLVSDEAIDLLTKMLKYDKN